MKYDRPTAIPMGIQGWLVLSFCLSFLFSSCQPKDPFQVAYEQNCSSCHGENMSGGALGPSLMGNELVHGHSVDDLIQSISEGFPAKGMPGYGQTLTPEEVHRIAILISEKRDNRKMTDFNIQRPIALPEGVVQSERHAFGMEVVATDLSPWPYSIAPLPDGSILLTEKTRAMKWISPDGQSAKVIEGTPQAYDDGEKSPGIGLLYGLGWLLDVAPHPDYEENGWIYLTYGDRCGGCNQVSKAIGQDVSMAKLVRARIQDGKWIDQETLWEVDKEMYTAIPDVSVGGRICFDGAGHIFFSVGGKQFSFVPQGNMEAYVGIQDLSQPYGKVYRIHDDGRIPEDNPFVNTPGAIPSIWTYGHRSPQGLEYDPATGQLWETEMGPRGGDEVNLLEPGKNYGWPLYSKGLNYNGSEVAYGQYEGIEWDLNEIEQPKVDLTPSPAVSSLIIYHGAQFPEWEGQLIVGSLKGTELYRYEVQNGEVVHQETLLKDLARIRDIEIDAEGYILLLLEHTAGSQIVRMAPR